MFHRFWFKLKRKVRYFLQRKFRGFDDSELWSLDITFANWAIPRLEQYNNINCGFPPNTTLEQFQNIINEILYGLELFRRRIEDCDNLYEETLIILEFEHSTKLFAEYIREIWT